MAVLTANLRDASSDFEFSCTRGDSLSEVADSRAALSLTFEFMTDIISAAREFINANGGEPTYFLGRLPDESFLNLLKLEEIIEREHALKLSAPFEGCDNISGDLWRGEKLLNRSEKDAIVKLKFDKFAVDLPSHIHSASDRVLIEYEGEGFFHPNFAAFDRHKNEDMQTVPIKKGDVICFPRNFIHTFSTLDSTMGDFSYHLPFIEMDDSLQYTMTTEIWYPRSRVL